MQYVLCKIDASINNTSSFSHLSSGSAPPVLVGLQYVTPVGNESAGASEPHVTAYQVAEVHRNRDLKVFATFEVLTWNYDLVVFTLIERL